MERRRGWTPRSCSAHECGPRCSAKGRCGGGVWSEFAQLREKGVAESPWESMISAHGAPPRKKAEDRVALMVVTVRPRAR